MMFPLRFKGIFHLAALAAALLLYPAITDAQDITSDLVGHWKLDETSGTTAVDSSTSGNDGTMVNGLDAGTDSVFAPLNTGLYLSGGTDQQLTISNSTETRATGGYGTWTIWFKTDGSWSTGQGGDATLMSKRSSNCASDGAGIGLTQAGVLSASFRNGGCWGGDDCSISYTNPGLFDDEWHHIAVTFGKLSTDRSYLYVDGTLVGSCSGNADWDFGGYNLRIGDGECTCEEEFKGSIDDIRIYDRALSADDIAYLYSQTGEEHTCSNPDGVTGEIQFNDDINVLQVCNGAVWASIGAAASINQNIVGHWTLDETTGSTITDSSDSGNDGTWSDNDDSDVTGETETGQIDTALTFDGTDDSISISGAPAMSAPFSFSAWINPTSVSTTAQSSFIVEGDNTNFYIKWDSDFGDAETLGFYSTTGSNVHASIGTVTTGDWHHIVGTYNGTTLRAYNNGVEVDTTASALIPRSSGSATQLGELFDGKIDDVRIYDRTLSAAEVQSLYELANPTCPSPISGLVGHWELDETSGSSIADISGSGNSGTWTDGDNDDVTEETQAGQIGASLAFDGADNIITVPHSTSLDISSGYTVSGWVYFDSSATGTITPGLISKNQTGGWGSGWVIGRTSAGGNIVSGKVRMGVYHNRDRTSFSSWDYPVDTWNYVTITWDGDTVIYYLNSSQVASSEVTDLPDTSTGDLLIGNGVSLWYNNKHHGGIDDLRVYNRALSETEISLLYGAVGGTCNVYFCESPLQPKGTILFNTDVNAMQYCNGNDWIAMGPASDGGGGCSNPTGLQAEMLYNETYNTLQYCEGDEWIGITAKTNLEFLTSGLIAHWKLDETSGTAITDSTGNGYDLTAQGVTPATDTVSGPDGTALSFDADNEALKIDSGSLPISTDVTVCAWAIDPDGSAGRLAGPGGAGGNWSYGLSATSFFISQDGLNSTTTSATATVPTNTWYHLCGTYDDTTDIVKLYVDGIEADSQSHSYGTMNSTFGSFAIGARYIGGVNPDSEFTGSIDDVRIYDRTFSSAEVQGLYISTQ